MPLISKTGSGCRVLNFLNLGSISPNLLWQTASADFSILNCLSVGAPIDASYCCFILLLSCGLQMVDCSWTGGAEVTLWLRSQSWFPAFSCHLCHWWWWSHHGSAPHFVADSNSHQNGQLQWACLRRQHHRGLHSRLKLLQAAQTIVQVRLQNLMLPFLGTIHRIFFGGALAEPTSHRKILWRGN